MKKISLLSMIAFIMAISFSAFTNANMHQKGEAEPWFYKDDVDTFYDDQTHYERLVDQDEGCSASLGIICVISAVEDGQSGYPDLSTATVETYKP